MTAKTISLEKHIRRLAVSWNIGGLILALSLSSALFYFLEMKDAERAIEMASTSAVAAHRTELLSGGDVLSAQLKIQKELSLTEKEKAYLLDANGLPWVKDLNPPIILPCMEKSGICQNVLHHKIISLTPIYFGDTNLSKWGYLYIEKSPHPNWFIIWSVTFAIVAGMVFQGLGFYFNLMRAVHTVSQTVFGWSEKISANPKNTKNYEKAPFTEMEPIETALLNLKNEIDILENQARQEGALTMLRGVGHDILNPVARMKRALGILELTKGNKVVLDHELYQTLQVNLRHLSAYAEQLKIIYKRQSGEGSSEPPIIDLSQEATILVKEISTDPVAINNEITIETRVMDGCYAKIPMGAFGRIIENLCSNSIHASKKKSSIFISVDSNGSRVSLTVKDKGHGIPAELKQKIFEPNFTTRPNQGTGLGLYVVKHICEQYGGIISLDSTVGMGTAITIEFPKIEVLHGLQNPAS